MQICSFLPPPQGFSVVFTTDAGSSTTVSRVVEEHCPIGLVYDARLEYCREGLVTSADDTLSDEFLVALWLQPGSIELSFSALGRRVMVQGESSVNKNISKHLRSALVKNFGLRSSQITALRFHGQDSRNTYLVATFRLTLTPYQDFLLANQNRTANLNTSSESLEFLELLKFTRNFTITSGPYRFPVIKLVSRQLACFEGTGLQAHEYITDKKTGNIIQNSTGKNFSRNDYTILEKDGGNITVCRRLVPSGCHNGSYVTLRENEYFIRENLTIFHFGTNRSFNFGEYLISEGSARHRGRLQTIDNTSFPVNSTIAVCLPYHRTFNTTRVDVVRKEMSYALRILTLIGLSISVLLLIILLVTYAIFRELRTLPGLNLMNLSSPMLLSHLVWLIGTARFQDTTACRILGMIEHYLFLVTFMAMSVISYHSCVVFSQPFGITRNSWRRFLKYSVLVWITPAIFVAVCVTVDTADTTFNIYAATCWLASDKAVLYFFLLPAAVLLLYNICTFVKTALVLSRHNRDAEILQKDRKENLMICSKLATLVGFPWLFAFFGVIFPQVEAFEYLFVIFVCLQGFYIGFAFVCNKKTLKLYRKRWRNDVGASSSNRTPTFRMS